MYGMLCRALRPLPFSKHTVSNNGIELISNNNAAIRVKCLANLHFTYIYVILLNRGKTLESTIANAIHVPSPGRRKGRYQASKPPLTWQDKIFNASEHEDPSGPKSHFQ